jgi:hypothetical protein
VRLGLEGGDAHLQTLKQANLVVTPREGTKVYYRLAAADAAALLALLRTVATEHLPDVEVARAAYLGLDTEQVTREKLLRRVRSGGVTVIDVRPREEYAAGHIPGALRIHWRDYPASWRNCRPIRRSSPTAAASTACSPPRPCACSPHRADLPGP